MKRIEARFARLAAQRRKALVPFVTAGDPSVEATVPVLHALVAAGADLLGTVAAANADAAAVEPEEKP